MTAAEGLIEDRLFGAGVVDMLLPACEHDCIRECDACPGAAPVVRGPGISTCRLAT